MAVKKYKHRASYSRDDFQSRRKSTEPPGGGVDANNQSRQRSSKVRDPRLLTHFVASKLKRVVEEFDDQTEADENCPPALQGQCIRTRISHEMAELKKRKNREEDRLSDDVTPRDLADISRIAAVPPTARTSPDRRRGRCEPEVDASIATITSSLMVASPVSLLNSTFNYPLHSTLLTNTDGDSDDVIGPLPRRRRGRTDVVNRAAINGDRTKSEKTDWRQSEQMADNDATDDVTIGPERRFQLADAVRNALLAGKLKELLGGSTTTTMTTECEVEGVRVIPVRKPTGAAEAAAATVTAADGELNAVDDLLHRTYSCRRRVGDGRSADDASSLSGFIVQPRGLRRRSDDKGSRWLTRAADVAGRLEPCDIHKVKRDSRRAAGARRLCHGQRVPCSVVRRHDVVAADLAALAWKSAAATTEGRPPVQAAGLVRQTGSSHLQLLGWTATASSRLPLPSTDRKRRLKRRKDGMMTCEADLWKRRSGEVKKRFREFRRLTADEKDRRLEVKFMGFV